MKTNNLPVYTSEEREAMREKAAATKAAKKLAGQHLKQDFLDEPKWREMASDIGFRLPQSHIPCSETKYLKRLLNVCSIDPRDWLAGEGYSSLREFSLDNPDWPAYAHLGLVLEQHFESLENEKEEEKKSEITSGKGVE